MTIETRMTVAEFEVFIAQQPDGDKRFELVYGEIVEKMPSEEHAFIAANLTIDIGNYLRQHPIGRVLVEARYQLPNDRDNSRQPDISVVLTTAPPQRHGALPTMPAIAIEIQSPRDSAVKLRDKAIYYLEKGARMVCLIYPEPQVVEVYTADDVVLLGIHSTLDASAILPGFRLPLANIFAQASP